MDVVCLACVDFVLSIKMLGLRVSQRAFTRLSRRLICSCCLNKALRLSEHAYLREHYFWIEPMHLAQVIFRDSIDVGCGDENMAIEPEIEVEKFSNFFRKSPSRRPAEAL
jgi:hypothetical protein